MNWRSTVARVDAFIDAINRAFPGLSLDIGQVRLVHRGLLPVAPNSDGVQRETTSALADHRRNGIHGLISVLGVRYTTARHTAEQAIDLALEQLPRVALPCRTTVAPLVGGDIADFSVFLRDATGATDGKLSVATRNRLARTYGTRHRAVLDRLLDSEQDRAPIGATCPVTAGKSGMPYRRKWQSDSPTRSCVAPKPARRDTGRTGPARRRHDHGRRARLDAATHRHRNRRCPTNLSDPGVREHISRH